MPRPAEADTFFWCRDVAGLAGRRQPIGDPLTVSVITQVRGERMFKQQALHAFVMEQEKHKMSKLIS